MNNLKKEKILIVGGTGFIGYHLALQLIKKNYIVHSISTKKPAKKRYVKGVKYILSDISNFSKIKKKINRNFYEFVINLAGYVDHNNKIKTYSSHYYGCKNLFRIFNNSKIKKFVQMGSSGEYGNLKSPHYEAFDAKPLTVYNQAKKKASDFLLNMYKNLNFPVTILRPYLVYGPYQDLNRFIPIVITGCIDKKRFDLSHCNQFRDFIYIDDLINLIIKVLKNKRSNGEIINVGSSKPVRLKAIVNKIKKLVKGGTPLYGKKSLRKDEGNKIYPNINKAKKLLNWKQKTSINQCIYKTVKYYKNTFKN